MIEQPENGEEKRRLAKGPFELSLSHEGLPATQLKNPDPLVYDIVREVMAANTLNNPDYHVRSSVSAFLQSGEDKNWILIEFWKGKQADHEAFIAHLNERVRAAKMTVESPK
jgi:hypothetical protein